MRCLTDRNILLISPQPWKHIFISKHHYAEELIKNNNRVYFLEPPSESISKGIQVKEHDTLENLFIISWSPFFPRTIRFHFYSLYVFLISIQINKIKRKLNISLDVVWSFDFNLFPDLRAFGANLAIFHPVDPLSNTKQVDIGGSADMIISVSKKILNNFDDDIFYKKTLLINHGLGDSFSKLANLPSIIGKEYSESINVGYFGNLDRTMINLNVWEEIIEKSIGVTFHFWGPYKKNRPFFKMMNKYSNVILYGEKNKQALAEEVSNMDVLLLIYSEDAIESDRSNSHKIIEYLATGKAIVSSRIEAYIQHDDLIIMPNDGDDNKIPSLFFEVLRNLKMYNSGDLIDARKSYAKRYTYETNLNRIDNWIADKGLLKN